MKQKHHHKKKTIAPASGRKFKTDYITTGWRPFAVIIIAVTLVFGRTIWFGYTYFDDDLIILKKIDSLSHLSGIIGAFKTLYFSIYYRPIVTISLVIDACISNINPCMYHLSNLVYHITAGCLTYILLLKLKSSRLTSLFGGILFVMHPLATQTVAWIPGRNDSLLALFILLSFLFLIDSVEKRNKLYYCLHILFFYIALFTKETALVFPIIALVYLSIISRVPLFSGKTVKYAAGWIPGIVLFYLLRGFAIIGLKINEGVISAPGILSNIPALIELIGKLLFPFRLSVYPTINIFSLAAGVFAIFLLLAFLVVRRKDINRLVVFSLIWIVLFNLPGLTVSIVDSHNRFSYLESRAYISIVGYFFLLAGIQSMMLNLSIKKLNYLLLPAAAFYLVISFNYCIAFENPLNHWEKAVEMSPNTSDTYFNLGVVLMDIYNDPVAAEINFKKACLLNESNSSYHNWLGIIYGQKNSLNNAENEFNAAIKYDSLNTDAYTNLGYLKYLNRNFSEAERCFKKAISVDSTLLSAYNKIIQLYCQKKDYNEAVKYVNVLQSKGLILDPALAEQIKSLK